MRILIACEESQAVCKEFRLKGHEAYSCDLQECSGGRPEWHYQQDIFDVIDFGWDMMIAFPPCTYLTVTANKWLKDQPKRESGKLVGKERRIAKIDAEDFFIKLFSSNIPKIAIENPIGSVNSIISPNQIIHPYYFEYYTTKTGKKYPKWSMIDAAKIKNLEERSKFRSKTFPGIAKAMADQWG
jgi:hypothetical protein